MIDRDDVLRDDLFIGLIADEQDVVKDRLQSWRVYGAQHKWIWTIGVCSKIFQYDPSETESSNIVAFTPWASLRLGLARIG